VHPPYEYVAVDGIPIAEQVLGRGLFREALDQLVGGPGGGGVVSDVDMDEFSTGVSKDQESEVVRSSRSSGGRPTKRPRDFQRQ
jgi:hypothetical protein